MNRPILWLLFLAGLGYTSAGCQTVERIDGIEYPVADGPKEDRRENALLAAIEEDDKNLAAWYSLGEHYESRLRFQEAYVAFANFQKRVTWEEERTRTPFVKRSTAGPFALGRVALRLGASDTAEQHYTELLKRQPKTLRQARLNPHFALAHLRLGEIHYARERYEKAYLHTMIHRELGGTEGDGILIGIEKHREREAKREATAKAQREQTVEPSHGAGQADDAQPAGSRK